MIKQLTNVLTGIIQSDGKSIANAMAFTDNGTNTVSPSMGYKWWEEDGDYQEEYDNDRYYACSLVGGTTYTIDGAGSFHEWSAPMAQFQDSNGSNVGTAMAGDMDYDTWEFVMTPGSFTPSSSGIYYLHINYGGDEMEVPITVSPAPQEYSLGVKQWAPMEGQTNKFGKLTKVYSSTVAGTPVLHIPLLNNASASVNTTNATITTEGTLTFNGDSTTFGTNNIRLEVEAPLVFVNSFTYGVMFKPTSNADWHELMFLYGDDARPNSGFSNRVLLACCSVNGVGHFCSYMYDNRAYGIVEDTKKPITGTWNTLLFSYDRDAQEVRVAYNGSLYGVRPLSPVEIADGGICKNGAGKIRLGGINGDRGFWGAMKHFKLWNQSFDRGTLLYLSSNFTN